MHVLTTLSTIILKAKTRLLSAQAKQTHHILLRPEKYKDLGVSVTEIARITEKSRSTIYKVLKDELSYISNRLVKEA